MKYYDIEQDLIEFTDEFLTLLNKIPRGVTWAALEDAIERAYNSFPSEDRRDVVIKGEKAYETLRKKYIKCLQELEEGDSAEEVTEERSA